MRFKFIAHAAGLLLALWASPMLAQSNYQQVVESTESGSKVFLEINLMHLQQSMDSIFLQLTESSTTNWGDILINGSNPGMDIDFSSYDITGLGGLTSTGTLTADSLFLNKDADLTGKLSVTDVVSFGDSLTVSGYVQFNDSLNVVKAVAIGETLYVTGVTALGDSLHVVGNVDLDALFNVDGAATFGSTLAVSGKTTLSDSLLVSSGARISGTLYADSAVVVDVINGQVSSLANHNTSGLAEGTNLYFTNERAIEALSDTLTYLLGLIAQLQDGGLGGGSDAFTCGTSTVTFDGHDYSTVLIGDQCWFAENLRSTQYADGSAIPELTDASAWQATTDGARAAYDNDADNLATYGYLYNWYAVDSAAGLCPTGWHVPTDAEWTTLTEGLGGASVAGPAMKSSASDTPSWEGTNSSGFSGLPGGYRANHGSFSDVGIDGYWWSSSPNSSDSWGRLLLSTNNYVYRPSFNLRSGFSVRCVGDAAVVSSASAPTVSSGAVSDLAETTATLNGTVDADGGDAVTATGFVWGTDAMLSGASDASGSATSGAFTASLTGLTSGTTYYFSAYATNGEGTDYGDTLSFTTTPAAAAFTCGTSAVTFDGHDYSTVVIGDQCWFAENLRSTQYADGSAIPELTDASAWQATTDGARAANGNDATNLSTYGYLYNWHAVNNAAGLCPTDWHVPTDAEWTTLTEGLGGASVAGEAMKSSASDTPAWNGTNTSGFSAIPGGNRDKDGQFFLGVSDAYGGWWSKSLETAYWAWFRNLRTTYNSGTVDRYSARLNSGFSVRCVGDAAVVSSASAPTVSSGAVSDLAETTATLNGTVDADGGDAVTATGFVWGTDAMLSGASDASGSATSGAFTASLTGLTSGTTYYFSAYATNGEGTDYGDTLSFTTTPAAAAFTCGTSAVTFDGHDYSTVVIGDQCWFAENLRSTQYADGSAIPELTDASAWQATTDGARAANGNDATNLSTYGYLYNWHAVNNAAGLCPTDWHVPTDAEWTTLTEGLGGASVAGEAMKSSASDTPAWNGTNTSGFSAIPGGNRDKDGQFFLGVSDAYGGWWSKSLETAYWAWFRNLRTTYNSGTVDRYSARLNSGFSVRCVGDAAVVSSASAPTVSSGAASDLAETTATLNGTVDADGGDAVTATGFVWGTDAMLSGASDASGSATSGAFTASLTGLTSGTTYYFSAYATNGEGTDYGDTLSFTTTPAAAAFTCGTSAVTFDGHDYSTVLIGDQCWFAENLRTTQYADGSAIPEETDASAWQATTDGARAAYDNDDFGNLATYGYLYNWYAVDSAAGLCPTGWHVPTDAEWTTLTDGLGGADVAGPAMKSSASDTPAWNGTNTSGFSGLPGGGRGSNGNFYGVGDAGSWWSSSPYDSSAWYRLLISNYDYVPRSNDYGQRYGFSVRCVGDAAVVSSASAPTVSSGAASDLAETTATLNGTVDADGGDAVTATGFVWGTDAMLSGASDASGSATSGAFTASLTGLTSGTTYYFSAYATNGEGTDYGDTLSFTTTPAAAAFTCGTSAVTFDGHAYSTVLIGDQCWFAENLRTTQYADGSAIPEETDASAWAATTDGARGAYNDDAGNLATYGYLYNWYAVDSASGLCPTGWHVPTDAEWTTLTDGLGGTSVAGPAMKSSASDTPSWDGTNSSGFSGLPGGSRFNNGGFNNVGNAGFWWSSSPASGAWSRQLYSSDDDVYRSNSSRRSGFSVRCVGDAAVVSSASAPTVSSGAASDLAETTATLNGTVDADGGDAVTATGFVWGTDAMLSGASDASGSATSGAFTASLTGLTSGTTYYFSAYATNGEGTDYGDTLSFTTTPAAAAFTCGTSTVTFDGHDYSTVLIGDQCWFAENLRSTQYADGSAIPEVTDASAWAATTDGARAAYDNDAGNLATYGYLYNWYAVDSAAGLCPTGWHVPTDAEWTTLTDGLGGTSVAGPAMKSSASDTPSWDGTNSSGFSALPGGLRGSDFGDFYDEGGSGYWWSASPSGASYAWYRGLYSVGDVVYRGYGNARDGFSVRCVRD